MNCVNKCDFGTKCFAKVEHFVLRLISLYISKSMRSYVIEEDLWVMKGDAVHFFEGANNAIGTLIMKFNSQEQLKEALEKQGEWLHISVD